MRRTSACAVLSVALLSVAAFQNQRVSGQPEPELPPLAFFDGAEQARFEAALAPADNQRLVRLKSRYALVDGTCPMPPSARQPFYVRLSQPLTQALLGRLRAAGAVTLAYYNENTYAIRALDEAALAAVAAVLRSDATVMGTVLRQSADACDAPLWHELEAGTAAAGEYRVGFWHDVWYATAIELVTNHGGEVLTERQDAFEPAELSALYLDAWLPAPAIAQLAGHPDVEFLCRRPVARLENQNSVTLSQANVSLVGPGTSYGLDGNGLVVGVWDAGDALETHSDFQNAPSPSPINNGTKRVRDAVGMSTHYHATHVTGTILGDGTGNAAARGFAAKACAVNYYFGTAVSGSQRASRFTYRHVVENHSYGASYGSSNMGGYDSISQEHDIIARDLLQLVCRSGGNSGSGSQTVGDDKHSKNNFQVGATDDAGNVISMSSRGPSDDGRLQPTIAANGNVVLSTYSNGSHAQLSGSSMASPAAAGSLTLITQHWRNKYARKPFPMDAALALVGVTALDRGNPGPDYVYGLGIIQVKAACDLINADVTAGGKQIVRGQARHNATVEYDLSVTSSTTPLRVALAWLDLDAAAGSAVTLVNDLDLTLVSPTGTLFYPYAGLTNGVGQSQTYVWTKTGPNRRDNVEVAVVDNPATGTWKVRVKGHNIPANARGVPNAVQGYVLCSNRPMVHNFSIVADALNTGSPVAIPDNDANGLIRTLSVSNSGTLKGVRVYLDIRHQARGNLEIMLEHPDGTQVLLEGTDSATTDDLIAIMPDTRQHNSDVTALIGKTANGAWKVHIRDKAAGNTGTLEFLSLEVETSAPTAPNTPPTANAGADFSVTEGNTATLQGSGSDPDGDTLTFSWAQIGGPTVTLNNPGSANASFSAPQVSAPTALTFRLTVSDGRGGSATDTVVVTVLDSAVNNPPNANAGLDQGALFGATVMMNGGASTDPDGDPITFAWVQIGGINTVTLSGAGSAIASFTAPATPDTLVFQLTVSDNRGGSTTDTITIHVNANGTIPTTGGGGGGGGGGGKKGGGGGGGCVATPGHGLAFGLAMFTVLSLARRRRRNN
ncbi:MAG: S8 family serine peptidase [Planctomycetes bacterium]|nr:S8 family serine peptidase [Planctomycetota bacterium]